MNVNPAPKESSQRAVQRPDAQEVHLDPPPRRHGGQVGFKDCETYVVNIWSVRMQIALKSATLSPN